MSLRVISGKAKGRKLRDVPGDTTRPVTDMVKEALFNILAGDVLDSVWWDLFAGTGAIGIEALSAGAAEVVFIEHLPAALSVLRHNIAKLEAGEKTRVVAMEFNRAVILLAGENFRFDIIFLDPPYRLLDERNPLKVIKKRDLLAPGGLIVLRHHFKTKFEAKYFALKRRTTLGDDTLSFYAQPGGDA